MKSLKKVFFIILLSFILLPVNAQGFGTGALFDPARYEQVPLKPVLVTRDYKSIPKSYSIKQYSPFAGNQNPYGTCVAWATAYSARTISESVALKRTNRSMTTNNVFSPVHIYKNITNNDPECKAGAYIIDALNFMKNEGAVKSIPEEKTMDFKAIPLSLYTTSKRYPISDYVRLTTEWPAMVLVEERVLPIKKSISEGKPVVIGMTIPPSFHGLYGKDLWLPSEKYARIYGGHAMCIVGYDDTKDNGSFEVQNSWGTAWGSSGFIWVRYSDFISWADEVYEIIEDLTNFKDAVNYGASLEIQVDKSTAGMPVRYERQGFYKTTSSYPSGTDFRFLITNKHPAYVYAFAADNNTPGTERIFPLFGISPILDYPDSTIAWPGEWQWIRLNEFPGTDYLVVLFSKYALDIDAIEKRFANEKGTFPQRVSRAVGSDFIPYSQAQFKTDAIEFSADSKNPKAVLGLLLAIDHAAR